MGVVRFPNTRRRGSADFFRRSLRGLQAGDDDGVVGVIGEAKGEELQHQSAGVM